MSLSYDNGGMVMPVSPMNSYANSGFGFGGDGAWWLLVLFLFAFNGNGFGFGNGNNDVQRGFDQQSIMGGLNGIQQTLVSNQNAIVQGLNSVSMGLQNAVCDNRAGIADVKYTIATEACNDRVAVSNGVRDIIANQNAGIQTILDKLCQQEIDALKAQNANLQTQINLANMQASQTAQTARILADNAAQTQALEQYLNPAPIPAYVVQNPNCCNNGYNFGCGCNG